MEFQWDPKKAQSNWQKHRIGFDEAETVFFDPLAQYMPDLDHSLTERREIVIGESSRRRLLVVVFTEAAPDLFRVISARRVTNTERIQYEQNG